MKKFTGWWKDNISLSSTRLLVAASLISLQMYTNLSVFVILLFLVDATTCMVLGYSFRDLTRAEEQFFRMLVTRIRIYTMAVLIALDIVYMVYASNVVLAAVLALSLSFYCRSFNAIYRRA